MVNRRDQQCPGCDQVVWARGLCKKHYMQDYYKGAIKARSLREKFWDESNVNKNGSTALHMDTPCWLWTGSSDKDGYAQYNSKKAHRLAYRLEVGEIPKGLLVDHRCRNRKCVRPDHLRIVTHKQNNENRARFTEYPSGIRGVHWDAARQKWVVLVTHNYKALYFGGYETIDEAEAVVIAKRNELFTHNDADRRILT